MINKFEGGNVFLSNFYTIDIIVDGNLWKTSEALYMSCKTHNLAWKEKIRLADTPGQAKRIGRNVSLVSNWDQIKNIVMLDCLRKKFSLNLDCKNKLIETLDHKLIEGNYWHDNYWGECYCDKCICKPSKNMLGKLLMQIRREITQPILF